MNRAKIRRNLKPVEILSHQDHCQNFDENGVNFSEYFKVILEKIEMDEEGLGKVQLGKAIHCKSCSLCVEVSENWMLHANLELISQIDNPSVENILKHLLEEASNTHKDKVNCKQPNLKTNEQEKLIIITFETPNKISIPNEIAHS